MKVVVVSGDSPHHRHLALTLSASHDLVGIVHPENTGKSNSQKFRSLVKRVKSEGPAPLKRAIDRRLPRLRDRWDNVRQTAKSEIEFFEKDSVEFDKELSSRAIKLNSINSPDSIQQIKALNPDAVVSMGGAIFRKGFIEAFPVTINLHAGISPVYNGTGSIFFAFANGHFRLCGGTLMMLSEKIDRGDILAHALPSIEPGNSPSSLFMKTIREESALVVELLTDMDSGMKPISIPQPKPFVYTRSTDRTADTDRQVQRLVSDDAIAKYACNSRSIAYWREPDFRGARDLLESTIGELICRS